VIADVDGDFNAEIVIGDNFNCPSMGFTTGRDCSGFGLGPRATDPLFAGLRCAANEECVSGRCDAGFCRCTSDDDCCRGPGCASAAFVCAPPPPGTAGTGNTCRASRPVGTRGIRVFRDTADRWVRSRMIWNQHAYTARDLPPGACEGVSCAWSNPPMEEPGVEVWVIADHDSEIFECRETNNITVYRNVRCGVLL
jgi:hypothetical protein